MKRVREDGDEAVRHKNIEVVMSLYAPEVERHDLVPQLALRGSRCIQKRLARSLLVVPGSDRLKMHDLTMTVGDDVAFARSLNHISGTMNTGLKTDLWLRWTVCWRRVNDTWLIVHHQMRCLSICSMAKQSLTSSQRKLAEVLVKASPQEEHGTSFSAEKKKHHPQISSSFT